MPSAATRYSHSHDPPTGHIIWNEAFTTPQSPTAVPELINSLDFTITKRRSLPDELLIGLTEAGWRWIFTPGPSVIPVETSSAHLAVYFSQAMALILAQMLQDAPLTNRMAITRSDSPLILTVHVGRNMSGSTDPGIWTWEFFYYLLSFLHIRAARGYSGLGCLWFVHPETLSYVRVLLTLQPEELP
ncbi:MAG: hypothetical protein LQ350_006203 [Teloschistes chrysophthalmus]|nr:MAG: hypothetical protein LQ350_006203 [Niorma chrysophthalma]